MKILEIKNIEKTYSSFKLDDVSFDIEEGSICGFIGRNGAGKTTTLKGIMGLIHLDKGEVKVFGHNIQENEEENRQDISFSLAELNYFTETRIGKLTEVTKRFYKNWNDETYKKLCEKFNLDESKRIKELSSGMKIKYELAIALSHKAKLLILDEPTSGLDPVSRDEILDIFKSIVKDGKRSILFSTHITPDLEKCADHIVYIRDGKIVAAKTKEEFLNSYLNVSGPLSILESIKEKLISFKIEGETFEGLINKDNGEKWPKDLTVSEPNLDTIMVYEENSGKEIKDEEFDF